MSVTWPGHLAVRDLVRNYQKREKQSNNPCDKYPNTLKSAKNNVYSYILFFPILSDVWRYISFFLIKPTRCTYFTNLFWHETLHVSYSSSVHRQEFIHCTLSCRQLLSRSICSCSTAVYKPVWHIPLLSVQWINSWWWTDELPETRRVSWRNKFVKLVHLFGLLQTSKTLGPLNKALYEFYVPVNRAAS
jgi:hypothetical protein